MRPRVIPWPFVVTDLSVGGVDTVRDLLKLTGDGLITAYDDRILGSGDFVERLKQEKEVAERLDNRIPLPHLIKRIAKFADIEPQELCHRGRKQQRRTRKS
jgi:hypothetical protein